MTFTRLVVDKRYKEEIVELAEYLLNNIGEFFHSDMARATGYVKETWIVDSNKWLEDKKERLKVLGIVQFLLFFADYRLDGQQFLLWRNYVNSKSAQPLLDFYMEKMVKTLEVDGEVFKI